MHDILVSVDHVSKKFCRDLRRSLWYGAKDLGSELLGRRRHSEALREDEFWAVRDACMKVRRGECLGLIGHNGAGKTTLLRMLTGLIQPDVGEIKLRGRVGSMIAVGAGFNPILTGRENIFVYGSTLGLGTSEIRRKYDSIVEFSGLSDSIDTPVQFYSSGMAIRLGFSIATALEPDILLLDEVLAVGDAEFKMKAYQRLAEMSRNCAVILVTHSISQLSRMCDRVSVMERGRLDEHPSIDSAIESYLSRAPHPDAGALHACAPGVRFDFTADPRMDDAESWKLCVAIECQPEATERVDLAIVNFTAQSGLLSAEYRNRNCGIELSPGRNDVLIEIDPPRLKHGRYTFDFALYSMGGKIPLVHVSRGGPVFCEGDSLTEAVVALDGTISSRGS